jgi:hypothetical protein
MPAGRFTRKKYAAMKDRNIWKEKSGFKIKKAAKKPCMVRDECRVS